MARGVNRVTLLGNLGKDPDVYHCAQGSLVVKLNIATTESYSDQNGQWHDTTHWHKVTLFKKRAEVARDYLKKGAKVYIEGKLQIQKYKDKEGKEQTNIAIIATDMQLLSGNNPISHSVSSANPSDTIPKAEEIDESDITF